MSRFQATGYLGGSLPRPRAAGLPVGNPQQINDAYNAAYTSAADINAANYSNILGGYQEAAAGQRSAQDALAAGYPELSGRIRADQQAALGGLRASNAGVRGGYGDVGSAAMGHLSWLPRGLTEQYQREADIGGGYGDLRTEGGDALREQFTRERDIGGGYAGLSRDVLGDIEGIGREEGYQIEDAYNRAAGRADQDLVSRGLGNTTVRTSAMRGAEFDRARARNDLAERMANLRAGYRSRLGLEGLGYTERAGREAIGQRRFNLGLGQSALDYRERAGREALNQGNLIGRERAGLLTGFGGEGLRAGERMGAAEADFASRASGYDAQIGLAGLAQRGRDIGDNTALAQDQLRWMNSVNAPYPDARGYLGAAQLAGQAAGGADRPRTVAEMIEAAGGGFGGGLTRVPGSGGTVPRIGVDSGRGVPPADRVSLGGGGYFGGGFGMPALNAGLTAGLPTDAFGNAAAGWEPPEAAMGPGYYGYDPDPMEGWSPEDQLPPEFDFDTGYGVYDF